MKKIVKKKIIILLDKKNNWINKYILKNKFFELKNNYIFKIKHNLYSNEKADLLFLLGFTKKLNILKYKNIKKFFLVHESNLPKGRGWSPVKYQILENKNKIKCCLISCEEKIDSGDIYETAILHINKTDLYDDIKTKQYKVTMKLIFRFLRKYPNVKSKKQTGNPSYYKKLTSENDKLDVDASISSQFNKIRSTDYNNHQNFFFINKKKFYIKISKKKIN